MKLTVFSLKIWMSLYTTVH